MGEDYGGAFWPGEPMTDQSRAFTMVSVGDGLDSLKRAHGDDWKQAVLFGDEADLVEQVAVDHYETFGIWPLKSTTHNDTYEWLGQTDPDRTIRLLG